MRRAAVAVVPSDLLEISITSKPMHPARRALSWKSADDWRYREGDKVLT